MKQSLILIVIFLLNIVFCNHNDAIAEEDRSCINQELIFKKYGIAGVRCYFSNGALKGESYINQDRHGIEKEYYENGSLRYQVPLRYGFRSGILKGYDENGKLREEIPFKNGNAEGVAKAYYESGRLRQEASFKNGKQEGIEKVSDETGELYLEVLYRNGNAVSGKCANGKNLTSKQLKADTDNIKCN